MKKKKAMYKSTCTEDYYAEKKTRKAKKKKRDRSLRVEDALTKRKNK